MTAKRSSRARQTLSAVLPLLFGAAIGAILGIAAISLERNAPPRLRLLLLPVLCVGLFLFLLLHLILHEAGHLLFGLIGGFRFCSFRIFSLAWVKENGAVRLHRLRIPGTAGQCLMTPPEGPEKTSSDVLYNLGGVLVNLFFAILSLALFFLTRTRPFLAALMLDSAMTAGLLALSNGIPMRGTVSNDGQNTVEILKYPEARRALRLQLSVTQCLSEGTPIERMPEEWFALPEEAMDQSSLAASIGAFAAARLEAQHRFAEEDALIGRLLSSENAMCGVHRGGLLCQRLYVRLITGCGQAEIEALLTPELASFRKSMKGQLTVLRTEYALALLHEKDPEKAQACLAAFEKAARTSPFPTDTETERGLLSLAREAGAQKDAE